MTKTLVGAFGLGPRNERGEWLAQWASAHRLTIASTMIEKALDSQWTHQNGSSRRQLDYCLISANRAPWVDDAGAVDDICVGTDHRGVQVTMTLKATERKLHQKLSEARCGTAVFAGPRQCIKRPRRAMSRNRKDSGGGSGQVQTGSTRER